MAEIYHASHGVPRLINLVADRALLAGYAAQTRDIQPEHVRKAVAALRGEDAEVEANISSRPPRRSRPSSAPALPERRAARRALWFAGVAVILGILFKGQNVAYMVSLAFAIAASGNFPALVLSIFWRRCTTEGIVSSMVVGTVSTLLLIWLSPTIQVDILKETGATFPLKNPALVTIPLSFATGWLVSLLTRDPIALEQYASVERRMHFGTE